MVHCGAKAETSNSGDNEKGNMEIFREIRNILEHVCSTEFASDSVSFQEKYHLEKRAIEEFPVKELVKTLGSTGSNYIFVQRNAEPQKPTDDDDDDVEEEEEERDADMQEESCEKLDTSTDVCKTRPLTVKEARRILSFYATAYNPYMGNNNETSVLPIWIACDGKGPEYASFIGSKVETSKSGKTIGISNFKVTCTGPIADKHALPSLEYLIGEHKRFSDSHNVSTQGFAQYDIFGSLALDLSVSSGNAGNCSSLVIDCSWDSVTNVLQVPSVNATATVHVKVVPGDQRSIIHPMYRELCTVLNIYKGLQTGEIQWARMTSEDEEDNLTEQVRRYIDELKKGVKYKSKEQPRLEESSKEKDFESLLHNQMMPEREDLDFTEQLWNILCNAGSYKEVIESLGIIHSALQCGDIQPMVHRSNQTLLAKEVRLSYQGKVENRKVDTSQPLELLVELGVDKIRRDYTTYFVGGKLIMMNELDFYTSTAIPIEDQIERVQRFYNVLELTVGSQAFLKLPQPNQRSLIRQSLKFYEDSPHNEVPIFDLHVPAPLVKGLYSGIHPSTWRLKLTSPGTSIATSYQLSSTPPFKHTNIEDQDVLTDNDEDSLHYYQTMITHSKIQYL
ncbi:protein zwilch homolog [Saccoglossus kowalevskii]|uniref:Protein zwilch n=1 Tax=Saccoglossus kowalevskii TaxID=10224 RepID=A0ABM0LWA4_SACKO|nr:PREDICTED: protein zwilch homolog [Saccoglossus kowalevskii]